MSLHPWPLLTRCQLHPPPHLRCDKQQCLQILPNIPSDTKSPLVKNHCSGPTLLSWPRRQHWCGAGSLWTQRPPPFICACSVPCTWSFVSILKHRQEVKLDGEVMWWEPVPHTFCLGPKCPTFVPETGTRIHVRAIRCHCYCYYYYCESWLDRSLSI